MPIHINDRMLKASVYALIALLLSMTWGIPGAGKLAGGGVPGWFADQFGKTFLATVPGLTASFYSIAVLEAIASLVAIASMLRGEFLRSVRPDFLYAAIVLSLLLFVQLSLGKQLVADFAGTHDLFMYFAAGLAMLFAVRSLDHPPAPSSAPRT